jgi:hypothetical protein
VLGVRQNASGDRIGRAGVTPVLGWYNVGENVTTAFPAFSYPLPTVAKFPSAVNQPAQRALVRAGVSLADTGLTEQFGVLQSFRVFAGPNSLNDGLA